MNTSHRTARILMSLLFCTFMVHFADAGTQWARTIGGPSYDGTRSIQRTSDGGYILAGVTNSFGAGGSDAWCVKLDSSGNVLWQKTYGGASDDYAESVQATSDGGYILAGGTNSFGAGNYDAW